MQKLILLLALVAFLASCTKTLTKTLSVNVSDYKKSEEATKRSFLVTAGPLTEVPEEMSKKVIEDIDSGKCGPDQKVVFTGFKDRNAGSSSDFKSYKCVD